jgi:urea carboxylase
MQALEAQSRDGAIDITPGIRSLQIHFQPETLAWRRCWRGCAASGTVCLSDDLQVPTRGASAALRRSGLPQGDR